MGVNENLLLWEPECLFQLGHKVSDSLIQDLLLLNSQEKVGFVCFFSKHAFLHYKNFLELLG